jgi:hypothetical protein
LLPSLPPGIRVSRPHNFVTLFLEKIGKVDPIPCPTFQGEGFTDQTLVGLSKNGSRKVRRENKAYRPP